MGTPSTAQVPSSNSTKDFADRLKELVTIAGSISELSRRSGVTHTQISRYLRRINAPSLAALQMLAHGGDVTPDWLLYGKEVPGVAEIIASRLKASQSGSGRDSVGPADIDDVLLDDIINTGEGLPFWKTLSEREKSRRIARAYLELRQMDKPRRTQIAGALMRRVASG